MTNFDSTATGRTSPKFRLQNFISALIGQLKQKLPDRPGQKFILATSCKDKGNDHLLAGDIALAAECYREAIKYNANYPEAHCNLGYAFWLQGNSDEALAYYRKAIDLNPTLVQAHQNLGNALATLGLMSEAKECFLRIIDFAPKNASAFFCLGEIACNQEEFTEAEILLLRATELNQDYAEAYAGLGFVHGINGRPLEAEFFYRKALAIKPDFEDAHLNLGNVLIDAGKLTEAETSLTKALEYNPENVDAISLLLTLRPYKAHEHYFGQLESLYNKRDTLSIQDQIKLNFSMAKAMEDAGHTDRSFIAYAEGNFLKTQMSCFDEDEVVRIFQNKYHIFNKEFLNACAVVHNEMPENHDARVPIFVVGMPKSGSTLIEQILSGQHGVFGAGELGIMNDIESKANVLLQSQNVHYVLSGLRELGQEYLDRVWEHSPDAHYIIDKMLGNFQNIGLIHLMLPNARIIHSMRDPIETCFSCFTQQFANGNLYSFDLKAMGRHYLRYRDMMKHWNDVLPANRILDVSYERLVADLEGETKNLFGYLNLPWNSHRLKFYENNRVVRTSSSVQVRKPIFLTSINRAKPYLPHLGPLIETLGTM